MTPIWIALIVLVVLYVILELTTKATKIFLRIAIVALLIGALVLNYTNPSDLWKDEVVNETQEEVNYTMKSNNTQVVDVQNDTKVSNESSEETYPISG